MRAFRDTAVLVVVSTGDNTRGETLEKATTAGGKGVWHLDC